jgi:hypothetical protein
MHTIGSTETHLQNNILLDYKLQKPVKRFDIIYNTDILEATWTGTCYPLLSSF